MVPTDILIGQRSLLFVGITWTVEAEEECEIRNDDGCDYENCAALVATIANPRTGR